MSIKEIFCQDKAISILQRAWACDRMPHAYIFAGPDGVGKFKTAGEWGKLLLCEQPVSASDGSVDSCGRCRSCEMFDAGSHPDFSHVYKELIQFTKDGKNKKTPVDLPIDVIREFLIGQVLVRPTYSARKVFVVSEAEKLNVASQNALLKVLEEPPAYCCVILLCTRMEKLLATTKSRCRIIRFGPIGEERIIENLKAGELEGAVTKYFARLAQGSLGAACKWAELESVGADFYRTKKELVDSLAKYKYADSLELASWILSENKRIADVWAKLEKDVSKTDINRRVAKAVIGVIVSALSDAMKLNIDAQGDMINFDQPERIKAIAARFDAELLAEKIIDAYESMRWIESNVNEKLIFEQLLLKLASCAILQG